jgi:hypothetical protein
MRRSSAPSTASSSCGICEDRAIEQYGQLQALLNGERVYPRLKELFNKADRIYNSGLFHFQTEKGRPEAPDELTPKLTIDDNVLKDIVGGLYYPDSPYEFSVLPADILGQVYEQFLGKVIKLTAGHHAKVEEKPEVRKAGGVYYTPTYIVDYIVKNTVGKLLEDKTPKQAATLRILDPACGSGSFLLGAYQHLLNWHRDWYVKDDPEKHTKELFQGQGGEWRLTTAKKKEILLNNIYGVDIDSQAVEVTKLSLLLKVLEGENEQTIQNQLKFFHDRALPDLGNNIKCGNSLIGPDFYQGEQQSLFQDEEERLKVNVFDWHDEFKGIMASGGFDAVIGNPPYIRVREFREIHPEQVPYLMAKYRCATHVWDIYLIFFERAVFLAKPAGKFGFIVPIQTLHQPNCESLRRILLAKTTIDSIADLSNLTVFKGPIVKNAIILCGKGRSKDSRIAIRLPESPDRLSEKPDWTWPQRKASDNSGHSLKLSLLSPTKLICEKIEKASWRLSELYYVTFGLRSCAKGTGQGGKDRLITDNRRARNAKPYLEGRDIKRYEAHPTGRYIRYLPDEMYSPRVPALFESEKVISQTMLSKMRLIATHDDKGHYVEQSLLCMIPHGVLTPKVATEVPPLKFALGVLNSTLESFYFRNAVIDYSLGGGLVHATPGSQGKLPLPRTRTADIDKMVELVERMLKLHKDLPKAKTAHEKTAIERQIAATDKQIDELVYKLYGLTEQEVGIVEGHRARREADTKRHEDTHPRGA